MEQLVRIQCRLEAEEGQGAANGLAEITKRQEDRRKISDELSAVSREMGFTGTIHFDHHIAPGCLFSQRDMHELGLQGLHGAPSLAQIWPSLLEALTGTYVVSYDFAHLKRILEKAAEQYKLASPVLIGECLLQRCLSYYQASGYVGLAPLCRLAGYPLPGPPDCTAIDRARGQLHLLQAMSLGAVGSGYGLLRDQPRESDIEPAERGEQNDTAADPTRI